MSKVDILVDSSNMTLYSQKLVELQSKLLEISQALDRFNTKLNDPSEVQWLGNGKEQCEAYFALVDRYASLVAGEPIEVTRVNCNSALDKKNSEGTYWHHISQLIECVNSFMTEAEKFSFYSSDKADCITMLENMNFYGG